MQFLIDQDGTIPSTVDVAALIAAGIRLVHPSPRPDAVEGMQIVEGQPEQRDGIWWQTWGLEPAPPQPPSPVPEEVTLWQFRAALRLSGNFERVQYALAQLSTPESILAAELFEYGNKITRRSTLASEIMRVLQVTDEEVDDLFRQADAIRV